MFLAATHMPTHLPADWPGWAVVVVAGFFALRWLVKLLGLGG